ncbi:immune inhibitor A [Neobacillus sp. MM2021_6]|uniref:immune inhibitor A domain-containing protein n=1 Tax=Bacillaceae TaxID=186817 RepID=UPI00140A5B17|nr:MULTISPECIES: immune inhibitor A domain-containing protein [Bacillaceae]MBO0959856.1 immune inhibitor A [Neobacillus sp. MM2021_6]NHC20496.1 M6 family metalloprotease domain-containing protein [Bacillus sp. MM2020_4]
MKKLIKSGLTTMVIAGTLFSGIPGNLPVSASASSPSTAKAHLSHAKSALDLALVNDEKIIALLIKQGKLSADASEAEKQKALADYLAFKGKQVGTNTIKDPLAPKVKAAESQKHEKFKKETKAGTSGKLQGSKTHPDPVKESASPGIKKKGKLLTLMVEYSDFAHNKIKKNETDNYYTDYNTQHFEDMIFGKNGVKGPNGENFVSQKQFYEQQSGGTYTVEGKAYGWLKVPGTAKYYGADSPAGGHDNLAPGGASKLIGDALNAAKAANVPLQDYDLEDPHDLDGDGNYWEPDGLVDHLQIIHSGMGQEAGGGSLGDNAIWSHRSAVFVDPDGLGKGLPGFYDYTVMPEDGATGVFAHEYGHDLGLPDEYDTIYSGAGDPIEYWSIMSSGSWSGDIPGTEPTGFSPWAKSYFQSTLGGKWTNPTKIDLADINKKGVNFLLDQANSPLGQNNQAIQVNLPTKKSPVNTPKTGSYEFWGGQADEIDTNMVTDVDLTGKSSAELTFDAWFDIEEQWDYAFVQVSTDNGATWKSLGNADTNSDAVSEAYPTILESLPGFSGNSDGWKEEKFDLSAYAGQNIKLRLRYITDWGSSFTGFFADNIKVVADGQTIVEEGGETDTPAFTLNGFEKFDGNKYTDQYYLLEWRNQKGVDAGLAHLRRGNSLMSYDGGLVVWYVDDSFTDNWTGIHPGDGFLGVVDAHDDTNLLIKNGNKVLGQAVTKFHLADAAFNFFPTSGLNISYPGQSLLFPSQPGVNLFNDSKDYNNAFLPDAGRNIGHYGLKVLVNDQAKDKSVGSITLSK